MQKAFVLSLIVVISSVLFGCEQNENKAGTLVQENVELELEGNSTENTTGSDALPAVTKPADNRFKSIEWIDLIPKNDLDALMNPPEYLNEIVDGSVEDQMTSQIENAINSANDDRYQQALVSIDVIPEMDNQAIKIPGFVVPLEFNEDQTVTQFFLVPFFGACIHQPPPPPNQIIFVNYPKGLELNTLYDPYWISGVLSTSIVQKELGTAAYTMEMEHGEIYTE